MKNIHHLLKIVRVCIFLIDFTQVLTIAKESSKVNNNLANTTMPAGGSVIDTNTERPEDTGTNSLGKSLFRQQKRMQCRNQSFTVV